MILAEISNDVEVVETTTSDPIHLLTQFFIPTTKSRLLELQEALKRNVENPHIDTITLLNERVYTADELGSDSLKIKQVVIERRVRFGELFAPRNFGYVVVANADIFLDETISRVRNTNLHCSKQVLALLRYEFTSTELQTCKLFGPRADSADTWIFHSNQPLPLHLFNFELGSPGCDNKLNYLFYLLGFSIYNVPSFVRSYHCHEGDTRSYTATTKLQPPFMLLAPTAPCVIFGVKTEELLPDLEKYNLRLGNQRLFEFIQNEKRFIVPRVAGIENVAAVKSRCKAPVSDAALQVLKNNAGLLFKTSTELQHFSDAYLKAFELSKMYASWEPWGNYYKHLMGSQTFLETIAPRQQFSASVFDIFNFIALGNPWTHALRGKKLLIISPFVDLIQAQSKSVYPIDLFPQCTFVYLKPPMTQASENNRGWDVEYTDFCTLLRTVEFDVALCSCGGYGNPVCTFIYETLQKSAIYVGGVLQMYFGIYGNRWIKERKDVLNLYMNTDWTRPNQKPKGYEKVENGCYW